MCFEHDARPPLPPIRGGAADGVDLRLISADETPIAAYGARAAHPTGNGMVIIPDVRGLHPYYEELALRFAEVGVDVTAIDLYSRTAGTGKRPEEFEYEPHVLQLRHQQVVADVAAAAAFLRSSDGGHVERLFTVGFCLGGRISFLQAAEGHGLAGVIGFYGWPVGPHRSGLPSPAEAAPRFGCPVLAIYGGADQGIPPKAIRDFDTALDGAGIAHRTIVYDGAPHSFFDRREAEHAEASADAWRQMLDFIGLPVG
jgi:carboxymethylenebutenolidase